jgi:lysophospholipase L1-like esterase
LGKTKEEGVVSRTALVVVGLGLLGGLSWTLLALFAYTVRVHTTDKVAIRIPGLLKTAKDASKGGALLIGDSISAMNEITTACGLRVFNAGVGGARVADWTPAAADLALLTKPRLVIIALGTNDADRRVSFDLAQWGTDYQDLIRNTPAQFHILVPPPITGRFDISKDRKRLADQRIAITTMAGPRIAVASVSDFTGKTRDGVHPTAAGRALWRAAIAQACRLHIGESH